MDIRKMLNDADMGWCDVGRVYYERYIVANNIQGYEGGCSYIRNDEEFDNRIKELCTELGDEYDAGMNRRNTLKTLHMVYRNPDILERNTDFEPTDVYRLTKNGNSLVEGTKAELEVFQTVQYDGNKWWFAKGADGTVLNNEQEVNDYQSNILRERKYVDRDAIDNFVLWKTE